MGALRWKLVLCLSHGLGDHIPGTAQGYRVLGEGGVLIFKCKNDLSQILRLLRIVLRWQLVLCL